MVFHRRITEDCKRRKTSRVFELDQAESFREPSVYYMNVSDESSQSRGLQQNVSDNKHYSNDPTRHTNDEELDDEDPPDIRDSFIDAIYSYATEDARRSIIVEYAASGEGQDRIVQNQKSNLTSNPKALGGGNANDQISQYMGMSRGSMCAGDPSNDDYMEPVQTSVM